jgi:hypothetical protein
MASFEDVADLPLPAAEEADESPFLDVEQIGIAPALSALRDGRVLVVAACIYYEDY